jgi:hypothetical protein
MRGANSLQTDHTDAAKTFKSHHIFADSCARFYWL